MGLIVKHENTTLSAVLSYFVGNCCERDFVKNVFYVPVINFQLLHSLPFLFLFFFRTIFLVIESSEHEVAHFLDSKLFDITYGVI